MTSLTFIEVVSVLESQLGAAVVEGPNYLEYNKQIVELNIQGFYVWALYIDYPRVGFLPDLFFHIHKPTKSWYSYIFAVKNIRNEHDLKFRINLSKQELLPRMLQSLFDESHDI